MSEKRLCGWGCGFVVPEPVRGGAVCPDCGHRLPRVGPEHCGDLYLFYTSKSDCVCNCDDCAQIAEARQTS